MITSHVILEGNNGWRPRMSGRVIFLSVTGMPTYLSKMDSYPKVPLTPYVEWNPSDIYDDGQWDDSDGDAIFCAKISTTSYTQSDDILKLILSGPEHLYPESPFQMMWPSPRVILMMNYSPIYRNLTPTNLKIIMASLHLLQSDPLAPNIPMQSHIT